jgi:hypothetical protein
MNCCNHCSDAGGLFSQRIAERELRHFRKKGPRRSTQILLRSIGPPKTHGMNLMDIGSGVGAIPHKLLASGLASAVVIDASAAYLEASAQEATRRGHRERLTYHHGDFVDLAKSLGPADIVTLDRVICCYPDVDKLVNSSAEKAMHVYALVYPRERWITRIGSVLVNALLRLRGGAFRIYIHSSSTIDALLRQHGFRRSFYGHTFLWQVITYVR